MESYFPSNQVRGHWPRFPHPYGNVSCRLLLRPRRTTLMLKSGRSGTRQPEVTIKSTSEQATGLSGDLQIRHLWQHQTNIIIDIRVTDTDAKIYISLPLNNVRETQEKENKKKYLLPCVAQRKHFTPFVVSVYCLLRREARMLLKQTTQHLATKWEGPPSLAHNCVHTHMCLAIARAAHWFIRASLVSSYMASCSHFQFEDGAKIRLHQNIPD